MLIIIDNLVVGTSGATQYPEIEPIRHVSEAALWIVDDLNYTQTIDGYHLRARTQAELDADPVYIAWSIELNAQTEYDTALLVWRTEVATWVKNPSFDVDTWVDANVTDLPSAKTAIKHLGNALQTIASLIRANYLE